MNAALIDDMRAEARRLHERAAHYAFTGDRQLAEDIVFAADKLTIAALAMDLAAAGERERREGTPRSIGEILVDLGQRIIKSAA